MRCRRTSGASERALVGEVISTVALAGQLSRELTVSDHSIDMEIEFKDDAGQAIERKLYSQPCRYAVVLTFFMYKRIC